MSEPTPTPSVVLVIVPRRTDLVLEARLRRMEEDISKSKRRMRSLFSGDGDRWWAIHLIRSRTISELRFADESNVDPEIAKWAKQFMIPIVNFHSEGVSDVSGRKNKAASGGAGEDKVSTEGAAAA